MTLWKDKDISDRNQSSDCQGLGVRARALVPGGGCPATCLGGKVLSVIIIGSHKLLIFQKLTDQMPTKGKFYYV